MVLPCSRGDAGGIGVHPHAGGCAGLLMLDSSGEAAPRAMLAYVSAAPWTTLSPTASSAAVRCRRRAGIATAGRGTVGRGHREQRLNRET
jgi:hypothetical protein